MNEKQNAQFESADKRFGPVSRSRVFNRILDAFGLRNRKVLDLGCAWGEHLVNFGPQSMGITSTPNEVEYGKSRNIRIIKGNVELIGELKLEEKFEAIWANNLFEHLVAPHAFLMRLKSLAEKDTILILGVPVIPKIVSLMNVTKFRGALASNHINFFTRESLRLSVERAGWNIDHVRPFMSSNGVVDKFASFFAPHLYVVARNNPSFRYPEKKVQEWRDEAHYRELLSIGQPKDDRLLL